MIFFFLADKKIKMHRKNERLHKRETKGETSSVSDERQIENDFSLNKK
jgi:hypothetical protein